jgi:hypothetical protein
MDMQKAFNPKVMGSILAGVVDFSVSKKQLVHDTQQLF